MGKAVKGIVERVCGRIKMRLETNWRAKMDLDGMGWIGGLD